MRVNYFSLNTLVLKETNKPFGKCTKCICSFEKLKKDGVYTV